MNNFSLTYFLLLCGTAVGQCPLCYDGSDPPDPSFVPGGRLGDLTCASLSFGASVPAPEEDGPTCEDWILIGMQCGCPVPPGGCPLCYDGSLPPVFEKEVLNSTCGIFTSAAGSSYSDGQTPSCEQWLQIGILCDCPVPDGACGLCEDGSPVPEQDLMIGLDRCADVIALASFSEGEECSAWQATAGVYCGCNNPVASEGYCRICGDGNLLPDPGFVPAVGDNTQRSCGQLEFNREGVSCDELQNQYADACCSCLFCSDGSTPPDLEAIPDDPAFGNATCGQLYERSMNPSTDESCDFFLQAGVACGCPLPASACTLCEDGTDLPDPERVLVSRTCQEFAIIALSAPQTECTAFQATIGNYCGCTNPVSSTGYCRICGEDTPLPDPAVTAFVDTDGNAISCAEVELNLDSPISCEDVKKFSQTCCNSSPVVSPVDNEAPVPATPVNPSPVSPASPPAPTTPTTPSAPSASSSAATARGYEYLMVIIAAVLMPWH